MEDLIKSLSNLTINNEDDIDSICQTLRNIKIDEIKDINPEEVKKVLFNFFEILAKKRRCFVASEIISNKYIY